MEAQTIMTWRRLHATAGILCFIVFVLSGQYMDIALNHLDGMPDGPRLMYRSAHIYMLFTGLLNLVLGTYLTAKTGPQARVLQTAGSVIMLLLPVLMTISFFLESRDMMLARPIASIAIYLALGGVAVHFFSAYMEQAK